LKYELEQNYSDRKIRELCKVENNVLKLFCLEAAKPLDPFVDQFGTMSSAGSNMFMQLLNTKLKYLCIQTGLPISDIYTRAWKPTFVHCFGFINNLAQLELTLKDVDRYLQPYKVSLETELLNLTEGLKRCSPGVPELRLVQEAILKVRNYWSICDYGDGACVFLQLRDVLNLTGDFTIIEKFATDVSYNNYSVQLYNRFVHGYS